jgi:hypothetical protein
MAFLFNLSLMPRASRKVMASTTDVASTAMQTLLNDAK